MKKALYWVLVGIFAVIFAISGYVVVDYLVLSNDRIQDANNIYGDFTWPNQTSDPNATTKPKFTLPTGTFFDGTTVPVRPTTVPDTLPGTIPGTLPGTIPGTVPGTVPGTIPGTVPGTMPSVPSTTVPTPPETVPTEPSLPPQTQPEHTHSFAETVIPPTCDNIGYSIFKCDCGVGYYDKEVAAVGHRFGAWQYGTGTIKQRIRTHTCSVCGHQETQSILSSLHKYINTNPDVVGWIRIVKDENASSDYNKYLVNYPILHRPADKDYYLYRDINGKYDRNGGGSIYLREQCDLLEPTDVLTIYGHAMYDGTMFGRLNRYKTKSFFQEHPYIQILNLYEEHTYQVVCIFKTSGTYGEGFPYHLYDDFEDEAEYEEFINGVRDLALLDSGIETQYGDKFICLSTCEYTQNNGRLVLVAKRIS